MQKEEITLKESIRNFSRKFLDTIQNQEIQVISHFDTDGISSAAIAIKTLKNLDKSFSIKILKSLDSNFISALPKDKPILFLDLASGSLEEIEKAGLQNVFIIDHHEITSEVPKNINIINPELIDKQKISGSGLTYLFSKEIDSKNKELAKLAILGMIGDRLEKEIDKLNNHILEDSEIKKLRGLLIYPSTRPLNRTLEYSSQPYIPEVTGDVKGVLELLRESGINSSNGKYPSIIELKEEEMKKLITSIMLRNPQCKNKDLVGDIFLLKMFNKLEDARELSAIINACSRSGHSEIALQVCLEIANAKKQAEAIHVKYKQQLINGLKFAKQTDKISGKGYEIIHAKHEIKDTMIGTITSILSSTYTAEEKILIGLAYYDNKIKVSARKTSSQGRNLRELLCQVMQEIPGEIGGHEQAAGCNFSMEHEDQFLDNLRKNLELEVIKVAN